MLKKSPARWSVGSSCRILPLLASLAIGFAFSPQDSSCAESFAFSTFAGNAGYGSVDGIGRDARFNFPEGVAVDSSGTLYVADRQNGTIRKVAPDGTTTTLAGSAGSFGSADGAGSSARFANPQGVAVDNKGNVYVADTANSTIRLISPAGVVTTMAGSPGMIGSSNGSNTFASFNLPGALAVDSSGVVYVADTYNSTIRMVTPRGSNWLVTTLAGTPNVNTNRDGTNAFAAFYHPDGITVGANRNLYVADTGNGLVRKISLFGSNWVTTTIAKISVPAGVSIGTNGTVYATSSGNNTLLKLVPGTNWALSTLAGTAGETGSADGPTNQALFNYPRGVAVGTNGVVYVADSLNNTIRKVIPSGIVSTVAGAAGGPGSSDGLQSFAAFNSPRGLATDGAGNIYVADSQNNSIRKVTNDGTTTTLAGRTGGSPGSRDGLGTNASFNLPAAVAIDSSTNLYVADFGNNQIRKLVRTGTNWLVTTLAGRAGTVYAGTITNIVVGITNLSFHIKSASLYTNYSGAITNVNAGMTNITVIITNTPFFTNGVGHVYSLATNSFTLPPAPSRLDGVGTNALFNHPTGLSFDRAGNLYVADGGTNGVRAISPSSLVTTLASSLGSYLDVFGTDLPYQSTALAIDPAGNIFIADSRNSTIRQITTNGSVSTLAGSPGLSGASDGTNAVVRFATPVAVALDSKGDLFVADQTSHTIRELVKSDTNWVVSTVGGWPNVSGSEDGVGASARFNQPGGLAFAPSGVLYIADSGNNTIRSGQTLAEPVSLVVQLLSGQVVLSWPASSVGFNLESSTNLANGTGWTLITNSPGLSASGDELLLTNSPTAPAVFYRLHRH